MITVREATKEDAALILPFMATVGGESDNLVTDEKGLPFSLGQEEAYLQHKQGSKNNIQLLAFEGNVLVGSAGCDTSSRQRICHGGEIGISVLKAYWNKGVGTLLLSNLVQWARNSETGLRKLSLTVRADNVRAIALYKRFGFVEEGKVKRLLQINGVFYDGITMVLLID
ncbi:acetyltransferase, ribosomal protein N-acetylase [Sphaerochaeta pleomorpha str. Grapes]|uniref:Acetyltransferase, ribosomal protein N-acetylase n=1 Tax=Sphaerochaeta pleomorpha (strain ATCC BAA-1885 / DSM 22778 / Grapes) TaxID=158190 RepID=G8QR90_SPHPG|nr:GNAT family protein [Sphaerochaeta pleomorpha]AEV31025.1 acetyltransferase, ribosomal protein N-acetylase [Sphaerochaeta pleomorpha str. Grapes]